MFSREFYKRSGIALCAMIAASLLMPGWAAAQSSLRGAVTAHSDLASVSGMQVLLYDTKGRQVAAATVDATGGYLFSNIPAGRYFVVAQRRVRTSSPSGDHAGPTPREERQERFVAAAHVEVNGSANVEQQDLTLSSTSGGVIIGKVTETDGLTPVVNVPVSAYDPLDGSWVATALTWPDGFYFLVVPEGEHVLDARRPARKLYGPVTYTGREGTISQGDNLALATRVTVNPNGIVFDKDFQIPQGTITVVSPNGGETWTAGSLATVTWTTTAVPPNIGVWIFIRDEVEGSGALFMSSLSPQAGDGQCTFRVPTWLGDGSNYIVDLWLSANGIVDILGSDQSAAPFTITGSTSSHRIDILSPYAGQPCWTAGTEQTISWTITDPGYLQAVLLDIEGVRVFINPPDYFSAGTGTLPWIVPPNIGDRTDYRALCLYSPSTLETDCFVPIALSPTFEICDSAPRPFLRNILPSPGQTWTAGTFENVCWESDDSTGYVYSNVVKNGAYYFSMTDGPVTTGCIGNQVCSYLADSDDYRVWSMLQTEDGLWVTNESDGDFRITGGQELVLTLISPNGGESWTAGTQQTIEWEPLDAGGREVEIRLIKSTGEGVAYIGQAPAEAGTFNWEICFYIPDLGADYAIEISLSYEYGCPGVSDKSDQPFSITGGQASTLTLTSFNDGGEYTAGQTYPITWDAVNADGRTVDIILFRSEEEGGAWTWNMHLGSVDAEEEHFEWTICPYLGESSHYHIRIQLSDQGCPWVADYSDQPFTITGGDPVVPTLELTWPVGGESWPVGTEQTITWNTDASEGEVCFELYVGGEPAMGLGCAPAVDGEFIWHVGPGGLPAGTDYSIRIGYELAGCPDLGVSDESGQFMITSASISGTVTDSGGSPLGGILVELLALPPGGGEYTSAYAVTEYGTGQYALIGVPPGNYRLRAGDELPWGIEPSVQDPVSQHWYERVEFGTDYDSAHALCQSRGGYLAEIGSAEENAWLWNNVAEGWCMLGGSDRDEEGTWIWANGEPWVYENWRDGEPSDWGALGEDYLVMEGPDGQWNDIPWLEGRFVCEYEQEPGPTANYARIYYPNTPYSNEVQIITVTAGQDLTGYDFTLPLGSTVTGHIRTTEDDPISGANIYMWPSQWHEGMDVGFRATSGDDGSYTIRHIPVGSYNLRADYPFCDYSYVSRYYNNKYANEGLDDLIIVLPQSISGIDFTLEYGGTLSGNIQAGGAPAENVWVGVNNVTTGQWTGGATDQDGNYLICGLLPGYYKVLPHAYSRGSAHFGYEYYDNKLTLDDADLVEISETGEKVIDFELDAGGTIQGTVYDQDTGQPLSGTLIDHHVWDGTSSKWGWNAVTDAYGHYTLIVKPATYLVQASRAGYLQEYFDGAFTPETATPIEVEVGQDYTGKDIYLNRTHNISGCVTKSGTSEPLSGVSLLAVAEPHVPGLSSMGISAGTCDPGNFIIEGLPDGTYSVTASAIGYFHKILYPVTITGADVTGLDFALDPTPTPDFDGDCDVDQDDFCIFQSCASGPAIPHDSSETCQQADFDNDGDVDQDDFAIFQRCYSGPDNPPDPNCAN